MGEAYFKRIRAAHKKHPEWTLKECRGHKPKEKIMYRISVAINAPVLMRDEDDFRKDVPCKNRYFGFLYQEWRTDKDGFNMGDAEKTLLKYMDRVLYALSNGMLSLPTRGYGISEFWFDYEIGFENPTEVVYDEDLKDTYILVTEEDDGSIMFKETGGL